MKLLCSVLLSLLLLTATPAPAETPPAKQMVIGVPTLLSGDWAELGGNMEKTIRTYQKHYLRHPVEFTFEDAKISGIDGLKAYQTLINVKHVDLLIGATSSNGTMAGAPLINNSRTLMISPVTGGSNVDNAGEWIFRLGNSDVLNGKLQAEIFKQRGLNKVAVLTEETEYTLDITKVFVAAFRKGGGEISYSNTFQPSTTDFRSQLTLLLRSKPAAIFIPTQTGSALALILNQLSQLGTFDGEIHTTFTAADNPDANALARGKFKGLHYLAPAYAKDHPRLKEFLQFYRSEHKREPLILFHSAAVIDALDILQAYLDKTGRYDSNEFRTYLLTNVKNYPGLLGQFSVDNAGNANTSFVPALIE